MKRGRGRAGGQTGRHYFAFLPAYFLRPSGRKMRMPRAARAKAVVTAVANLSKGGQRASCRVWKVDKG